MKKHLSETNFNQGSSEFNQFDVLSSQNSTHLVKDVDFYTNIWNLVLGELSKLYGEALFKNWFSKIELFKVHQEKIVLKAPTNFIRDWIKVKYLTNIQKIWLEYDDAIKDIEIISYEKSEEATAIISKESGIIVNDSYSESVSSVDNKNIFSKLDPRFTFDNFIVGRPNELAYAASRSIAESKIVVAESNPLFLYGGVGLGKTHLMHAIAWYIKNHDPTRRVVYMSAETFMHQFVAALRRRDTLSFKEALRSVDLLMIDDVQFICGKDGTQEEFFHTFNSIMSNNKQIVISSDCSPSNLDNIEDRIKSRLGWGLVVDVHNTTYELRLGILLSKVAQMNIFVPKEVIEFLASKIISNVRELEGALNRVIAHSTLVGREITLENTQEILSDLLRANQKNINVEDIQKKISEYYGIKVSELTSSARDRKLSLPRQIAMYFSRILTTQSLVEIGKKFSKKDHTTVMHAIKKIEELIDNDPSIKEEISILNKLLKQ